MKKIQKMFITSIISIVLTFQFVQAQSTLFNENPSIWLKGNPADSIFFNGNSVIKNNELYEIKNKLAGKSTLFVVFKTNPTDSTNLIKLDYGIEKLLIRNSKIVNQQNELVCNLLNSSNGQIITYFQSNSRLGAKARNKLFVDLLNQTNENCQFLELIYFPKVLSPVSTRKIETYLSVKYGISLQTDKDYVTINNDTIWKANLNSEFSHRVTGIARNVYYNQIRSRNSENDNIFIAYDTLNNAQDEMFLIGDNNQSLSFNEQVLYNRKWRFIKSQTQDSLGISTFRLQFKKSILNGELENLNLVVASDIGDFQQISNCLVYPVSSQDSLYIYFDGIHFSDDGYFTLSKTQNMTLTERKVIDCKSNTLRSNYTVLGGTPPYQVTVIDDKLKSRRAIELVKTSQFIQNVNQTNSITIEVTDKNNQKITHVTSNQNLESLVTIPNEVIIEENKETSITPIIKNEDQLKLSYQWIFQNLVLSQEKVLTVSKPGIYQFKVINGTCELNYVIEVKKIENSNFNNIQLIQNPIKANQAFTIEYQLVNNENIDLSIIDSLGKLIDTKQIKNTNKGHLEGLISSSGIYFITVKTPSISKTFKLIAQ